MSSISDYSLAQESTTHDLVYDYSCRALLGIVWISSFIFGLYILANYASAYFDNDLQRWNEVLPEIYTPGQPAASIVIGLHFAAGGLILLLGGLQLIQSIRVSYPVFHRWSGRFYVVVSMIAALGGLSFIAIRGTVGGTVMDIGFSGYGILMFIASIQTMKHAMQRNFMLHQAWAWRLYALAIGSWLYRMDYGLWLLLTDWVGHTEQFDGWFDNVMSFFFYIPNLIIVELMIRARDRSKNVRIRNAASASMILASVVLVIATWGFARVAWIPAIAEWAVG